MNLPRTETTGAPVPSPREEVEGKAAPEAEALLCIESLARQLNPPQLEKKPTYGNVTQNKHALEDLFRRPRSLGHRSISRMVTGFERPHGKEPR